jgi:hypothetical protein
MLNPEDACAVHAREGLAEPDCAWCNAVAVGNIENEQGPDYRLLQGVPRD